MLLKDLKQERVAQWVKKEVSEGVDIGKECDGVNEGVVKKNKQSGGLSSE